MKTQPLLNYALIEVQQDYEAVSRVDANEILSKGVVRAISYVPFHLTASAATTFTTDEQVYLSDYTESLLHKQVRWEQYAEGGQTFEEDGKTYALIPWWRLISVTDNEEK